MATTFINILFKIEIAIVAANYQNSTGYAIAQ